MRPPVWMYLPHLGCGGGCDPRALSDDVRNGIRDPAEPAYPGAARAELATATSETPPVRARSSANCAAVRPAETASIRGRGLAPGGEETRGGCGGTTEKVSDGIRGRHRAPGRAREKVEEGLAEQGGGGTHDEPGSHEKVTNVGNMTGMAWYFADLAETAAKRKREHGDVQRPSATERMQALRRRLAARLAAAEPSGGASLNEGASDAGTEEDRPRLTGAAEAAASAVAWHGVEQDEGGTRREPRGEHRPCASPSEPPV